MEKQKKARKGINPLVTILIIIIFAVILTYVMPARQFENNKDETGNAVIDIEIFQYIERSPVSFLSIPSQITGAFAKSISIIALIAAGSGAFEVIRQTSTVDAIIGLALEKMCGNGKKVIWIVCLIFTLLSYAVIPHVFIPFMPMCIALALALEYDDFTGTAMILLSTVVGATGAPIAPGTAAAQSMLGLPAYSGAHYRFAIMFLYYVITVIYLIRYAERVKKDPSKSVVADIGEDRKKLITNYEVTSYPKTTLSHAAVIAMMAAAFALMIFGGYKLKCFTNFVLPYNSGLVRFLEAGHVSFGSWVKFFKGLLILWFALGAVILILLHIVGIGRF